MIHLILRAERTRQAHRLMRPRGTTERGMTLLEIMIVLAIIALIMGLFVGPRIIGAFTAAEKKTFWMTAKQFSSQAYPRWRSQNVGQRCPNSLADLTKYMNQTDIKDYQGKDGKDLYLMYCGDRAKNIQGGFGVAYIGEDNQPDTVDDIKSWDKRPKD